MEWNVIKNAKENDPMLGDAQERDIVLDGLLEYESEMNNNHYDGIQRAYNNPSIITDEVDQVYQLTNLETPAPATILEPQSIQILPEFNEQNDAPSVCAKKRKVPTPAGSMVIGQQRKRGRPQMTDDEKITDATAIRKRIYARKYQKNKKADFEIKNNMLQSVFRALKDLDSNNFQGILEAVEVLAPGFKKMSNMT